MNGNLINTVYCGGLALTTSRTGDEGLCCLDEIFSLDERLEGARPAIGVAFELCLDRGLSRTGNADEDGDILARPCQLGIDGRLMMVRSRDVVVETRGDKLLARDPVSCCTWAHACSVSVPMLYFCRVFEAENIKKGNVKNLMISQACTIDTLATE